MESESEPEPFQSSGSEYVPEEINEIIPCSDSEEESEQSKLLQEPAPKKSRSIEKKITDFFTIEHDPKSMKKTDKIGICTQCQIKRTVLKMKNCGTSSLKRHLQSKHIKVYEKFFGNTEQSTSSASTSKAGTVSSWLSDSGSFIHQKVRHITRKNVRLDHFTCFDTN